MPFSEKDAKDAAQFGLQKKVDQNHVDGNQLDTTWRAKGSGLHGIDLDESSSLHEDEKMREAREKIIESGGLSLADLGMPGPAARQMGSGIEQAAGNVAQDLMHQSYSNGTPDEAALMAESYGGRPNAPQGSWGVQKFSARVKGMANPIPVWKVIDEDTNVEVPTVFRVQEPAERAVAILNESGNFNDPRFKGLIKAYNQHVALMKEARQMRRAIKEGRTSLKPRLQQVLGELETLNYKLGI